MRIFIVLILIISSCSAQSRDDIEKGDAYKIIYGDRNDLIFIVEHDRCQYIIYDGSQKGGIIHKQNCPNH